MKKTLIIGILSIIAILFGLATSTGCSTTGGTGGTNTLSVQKFLPGIRAAAFGGTTYVLSERPEWRPQFQTAAEQLQKLATAPTVDWPTVMSIVQQLPVQELKSEEARLAIAGATILLVRYGDNIDITKVKDVQPIAKALGDGITQALNTVQ